MKKYLIVETTYPNLRSAKSLGKILITQNLAACVHFCEISSMYSWQGKIENDREILVRIKTRSALYQKIEKIIKKHHSYKVPQILAIGVDKGSKDYFSWLEQSTLIVVR